ncbi:MAG: rhodanese-like domain-containing protein [Verrucomicrobia bacterium]|nr:rhodanese-like domain-containing protein [Verrucomicrobiota bacterium]MBV9671464.1 rhodanese-like domain-containing protein [Verrucomicrobiota bacterium]
MRSVRQALLILVMAFALAAVSIAINPNRPVWSEDILRKGEVRLETALSWGSDALWIDARPEIDFQIDHVPGAISLNLENWTALFPRFLDKWQPGQKVVVYCSSKSCELSHEVASRLDQNGVTEVWVLKGGWESWKAER